jgi:hypothetical protein
MSDRVMKICVLVALLVFLAAAGTLAALTGVWVSERGTVHGPINTMQDAAAIEGQQRATGDYSPLHKQ